MFQIKNLNVKCPITMTSWDGDQTTMLPCGHIFNTESREWVMPINKMQFVVMN